MSKKLRHNKAKNNKINVRLAVRAAKEYLHFLQNILGFKIQDLRLEEVELSKDRKYWLITLGFIVDTIEEESFLPKKERDYKIFKVNSKTGEVKSMKIREL